MDKKPQKVSVTIVDQQTQEPRMVNITIVEDRTNEKPIPINVTIGKEVSGIKILPLPIVGEPDEPRVTTKVFVEQLEAKRDRDEAIEHRAKELD